MFHFETDQQKEMRASVHKFARAEFPKFQDTAHYNSIPKALRDTIAAQGLFGLVVPESFGGLGERATTSAIVMEELAAADLGPAIFVSVHAMVSGLISRWGSDEVKKRFLPKLATGAFLGAFALTEPSAGSDAAALATTARLSGAHYILSGEKCYITSAGFAELYLVFAKTDSTKGNKGISAFLVEKDAPGLIISSPEKKMGCELSPIASLTFSDCKIPAASMIGNPGEGYTVALSGLAGGRINISACANGLSREALGLSMAHLKTRKQFGAPLADLQGLQFMIAEMKIKLEAAQLLTWQAAQIQDHALQSAEERVAPSVAKCFATDAAMEITTDAVQLLGGAGYLKDYRVEKLMRDAKMLQIVEGANQVQKAIIARTLLA